MAGANSLFGVDLRGFQLTPDRLLGLIRAAAESGAGGFLVEWEDSYPWSIDERMRGTNCYSDEVVVGIRALCREMGLLQLPLLARGGLPHCLYRLPGFRTVLEFDSSAHALQAHGSAAGRLAKEVIDDLASFGGIDDGVALRVDEFSRHHIDLYARSFLTPLLRELRRESVPVWLVGDGGQAAELQHALQEAGFMDAAGGERAIAILANSSRLPWVYRATGGAGDRAVLYQTRSGYVGAQSRPLVAHLRSALSDLLASEKVTEEQCAHGELFAVSDEMGELFDRLYRTLDLTEESARRLEELHATVSRDSGRRLAARSWLQRYRSQMDALLSAVEERQGELERKLSGWLCDGVLESFNAERVLPATERLKSALMRAERLLM